jgi:hypothetical protein
MSDDSPGKRLRREEATGASGDKQVDLTPSDDEEEDEDKPASRA